MSQTSLNSVIVLHIHKYLRDILMSLVNIGSELVKGSSYLEALFGNANGY